MRSSVPVASVARKAAVAAVLASATLANRSWIPTRAGAVLLAVVDEA
jgi:hypothetical protein